MQLYLLVCCFPRVTRLKSFSLHLYTFIQFQIRFKTRLQDRNKSTICHLFSQQLHSHNGRVENASFFKPLCFMVKKYRKWSFLKLSNRFWWCNIVLSRSPRCTCTKPNTVPICFLNCESPGSFIIWKVFDGFLRKHIKHVQVFVK